MAKTGNPQGLEAKVIRKLPAKLERQIGRVAILYSNLEHSFTAMVGTILQLHKSEARLVLQSPRVQDRLDVVQDLLALKGFHPNFDFDGYREQLADTNNKRNDIIHGVWLKHPHTGEIMLRLTRGYWDKKANEPRVKRAIFPEAVTMSAKDCGRFAKQIENAIQGSMSLGRYIDRIAKASPDRFRSRAPVVDPLARRVPKKPPALRSASPEKPSKAMRRKARTEAALAKKDGK